MEGDAKVAPSDGCVHLSFRTLCSKQLTSIGIETTMDPYAELRKHAGGKHPQKAKLCIVLSAIEDVIQERRQASKNAAQPISYTEYFAALMTALESATGSHQQEITQLLSMVLPYTSEAVLRAKFGAIGKILTQVIQEAEGDGALIRSATTCLGMTLLAQEPTASAWSRPEVLRAFHLLLAMATDARPKIRKLGQKAIADILELHAEHQCDTLSTHIASFAENVFSASTSKDEARLVQLIGFLKVALPYLQRKVVSSLVDALTKYINSSVKNLRLVTYEAFDALAQAATSKLNQDTLVKMLTMVLNAESSTVHDADLAIHVVSLLENALVRLSTINEPMGREFLPRVVVMVCAHLENSKRAVQLQSAQSLLLIMTQCVTPELLETEADATDIARVLSSIQSLMTLRFQAAWDQIFPLLAELFTFYGEASSPALYPILTTSCELHEASAQMGGRANSKEMANLFEQVAGAAVGAIGPQKFLEIIPMTHPTEIIDEKRVWLFPVLQDALKSYPCELEFFSSKLLDLARQCEAKSRADDVTPLLAKKYQILTMQLWRLFPTFCANCVDIDTSFKSIAKLLANAMADKRYPELRLTVCQGLQALVKKTRAITKRVQLVDGDEADDEADEDEDDYEDDEEVDEEKLARDRAALGKYASRYLPLLITFVEELDPEKDADRAQVLLETIQGFASLAEAAYVSTTFRKIMQTLLEATTDAKRLEAGEMTTNPKNLTKSPEKLKHVAHSQLALATALVSHMDMENVNLLYRVIKPYLLDDTDGAMQKRSYAVLVSICDNHPSFMAAEENLKDMTESICESLLTCSIPAKKMRLRCLVYLIRAMQHTDAATIPAGDLIPNLVGEIMLCTKEANGKAREAAFELLIAMANLLRAKQPETGLVEFVQMLLGGLAARTPHMRSAAVICLSRVVFEFGREDASVQQMMPQLLKTVLMLFHEKAREVIKSSISFMKLGIAMLSRKELEAFLPDIINGLLVWIGESKNRFRAKTRIILIKLCRKYGYEKIAAIVPPEDRALIKHIKKTREREDKKKDKLRQQKKDGTGSFDAFMADSEDEGDFDIDVEGGDDAENAAFRAALRRKKELVNKKKGLAAKKQIHEDGDEIMDFLDSNAAVKNIRAARVDDGSDDDMIDLPTSKDGRFIIPEDSAMGEDDDDSDDDDEDAIKNDVARQLERMGLNKSAGAKGNRKRGRDDEEEVGAGKEYRSKKAGGDIKKKGKFEPYAYIPLDPKLMAKRNKRNAVAKYKSNVGKRKNLK
ncbi:hypothetical protein Poli38472_002485 [Pythium oligandrum]|uniref:Ribosomal RNA-processing protein 12-like conserved domain-containing protein n=1 Tax=Pythium oligandrum TaxID=41045 RepID=A0A8K1CI87_PYTOL|nr:hypothetical protein Poli38472_002485 [Pythium oligandrum]|eukprot:TMW63544.1 hypothetical protein Poli38472_002485 [Pythium oligandrum]